MFEPKDSKGQPLSYDNLMNNSTAVRPTTDTERLDAIEVLQSVFKRKENLRSFYPAMEEIPCNCKGRGSFRKVLEEFKKTNDDCMSRLESTSGDCRKNPQGCWCWCTRNTMEKVKLLECYEGALGELNTELRRNPGTVKQVCRNNCEDIRCIIDMHYKVLSATYILGPQPCELRLHGIGGLGMAVTELRGHCPECLDNGAARRELLQKPWRR